MAGSMYDYPRYLEKEFTPFDPLELARRTEELACINCSNGSSDPMIGALLRIMVRDFVAAAIRAEAGQAREEK